jgi:small-conductance mechanosensitive channel
MRVEREPRCRQLGPKVAGTSAGYNMRRNDVDPKKLDRVTRGVEKAVKQQQARAIVRERLERNARASKQHLLAPRLDILSDGHR